jgi:23S rRNA (uracil1939-C5)-methyltransferase
MVSCGLLGYHADIMAPGEAVELEIKKLVAGGDGLAFLDGKAVFVPFALPGERVLATLTGGRKDYSTATLTEVLEASPHRVVPPCGVYGECGGCDLQHLAYPRQVEEKVAIVAESFRRVARLDPGPIGAVSSLPFAYRNRMQLHLTGDGRLGFMRRASNAIVEAHTCPIAVKSIQSWIEARTGGARAREELRSFIVGKDRFIAFGSGDRVWLEGRDSLIDIEVAGEPFRFHIKGFFQSNLHLLDFLVPDVMSGLEGRAGGTVADLYCGVGLFSRFLSKRFSKVVCVEHNPFALDLARHNAPGAGNEHHALSSEDWVKSPSAHQPLDCVLVDPPRTGLSPEVKAWMGARKPPLIVYVSCDPVTLARDAGELCRAGYALDCLKVFDFYPQTHHIECHARFRLS